jgi:hypothetical protein
MIYCSKGICQPGKHAAPTSASAFQKGYTLGAVSIAVREYFGSREIKSLIPGDPLPLTLAPPSDPFHRIEQTCSIIDEIRGSQSFGAQNTSRDRGFRISLDFEHLPAVFIYKNQGFTGGVAGEAGRSDGLHIRRQPSHPGPTKRMHSRVQS